DRDWTAVAVARLRLRVERKLQRGVHGQRDPIEARMIGGLLHLDMQIRTACHLRQGVAGFAPVRVGPSTGTRPLRTAPVTFDDPRSWFEQLEVRRDDNW